MAGIDGIEILVIIVFLVVLVFLVILYLQKNIVGLEDAFYDALGGERSVHGVEMQTGHARIA